MTRLYILTFVAPPKDHHVDDHAHEAEPLMTVPLILLAIPTVHRRFRRLPRRRQGAGLHRRLPGVRVHGEPEKFDFNVGHRGALDGAGRRRRAVGWYALAGPAEIATRVRETFSPIATLLSHRYYIDDIYQFVINYICSGSANSSRCLTARSSTTPALTARRGSVTSPATS